MASHLVLCFIYVPFKKTSQHDLKIVDWDIKHQLQQTNQIVFVLWRLIWFFIVYILCSFQENVNMGEVFRIIPEFRILIMAFHGNSASKF